LKRLALFLLCLAVPAFAQRAGPFNLTAQNQCAPVNVSSGTSSTVAINVSGTWSATLQPEVQIAAQTPDNTSVTPSGSTTPQSTITANGIYQASVAGVDLFQVCVTSSITGTAVLYLNVSTGVASNLLGTGGGGGGGGTVTEIDTSTPITGGPITGVGTIGCATCAIGPGTSTAGHLATFLNTDGITLADGGVIPGATVTSVGLSVNGTSPSGIFTITGSPVTTAGTLNFNLAGTSGGLAYFSSASVLSSGGVETLSALIKGAGAGAAPVPSQTFDDGTTPTLSGHGFDVSSTGDFQWQISNNAVTGTTANHMACPDASGLAIICDHTQAATLVPFGVAVPGNGAAPGTTGKTAICWIGFCSVVFDNTATPRHYAQQSTSISGDLTDVGATAPTNGQPYYSIDTGNSGAGTQAIIRELSGDELNASGQGGGGTAVRINGTKSQPNLDLNSTLPAAAAGHLNLPWVSSKSGNLTSAAVSPLISGSTSTLGTTSGTLTSGHNAGFDGSGNIVDNGAEHTGTVTSVTFTGDGTMLSSTPSSSVTTSGTLTASLATTAHDTVFGNVTSGTAAGAYSAAPAGGTNGCSGTTDTAIYTAGTGWGCHQITPGTGTVTSIGLAGTANQVTVTGTSPITTSGSWTLSLPAAVILGTDASAAGSLQTANGAGGGAHTIWGSAATTSNTILGFATAPTTGHLVSATVSGTTTTLTDGGAPYSLPTQYTQLHLQGGGIGDGFNAIPAQTYTLFLYHNDSGVTWTLTGLSCWTDNNGTSTMDVQNNAGTSFLTAPVTCTNVKSTGGAPGTQSATTTIPNGDGATFIFVSDGASKDFTPFVKATQ